MENEVADELSRGGPQSSDTSFNDTLKPPNMLAALKNLSLKKLEENIMSAAGEKLEENGM